MALLINNQAAFVSQQQAIAKQMVDTDRINADRFARIEATMADHTRILIDVVQRLQSLEQAVREKIGFKTP